MSNKKTSALLGSILLLAAAMPLATAHLTNTAGSWTSGLFTGDDCRWEGSFPGTAGCSSDGVSGSYVTNPRSVFLTGGDVFPLTVPDQTGGVTGDITLFPLGYASVGSALCDLEVLGPGGPPAPEDETTVDAGPNNGGSVQDGTWDDGGIGGACHTEDQYALASYNTPGCGSPTHAVAEDAVSGGNVWIGASCDETTAEGSSPSLTQCLINEAISGADPAVLIDCVETFVNGNQVTPVITCGSDSISDAISYGSGYGSGSTHGVPFPSSGCGGGSAVVFVFNYVSLGGNPCNASCEAEVIPATAGWIDSRSGLLSTPTFGPGHVVGTIPACATVLADEDGNSDGNHWRPDDGDGTLLDTFLDAFTGADDEQCNGPFDNDENGPSNKGAVPQCMDLVDNDHDGKVDYFNTGLGATDPECLGPFDDDESA